MVRRDPESTRAAILEAAWGQIYAHGFQTTGVDQILARTGVTKGALYHHFKNKQELGYAVFDEVVRPLMLSRWLEPLRGSDDPLTTLKELLYVGGEEELSQFLTFGCPLNNLTQELAGADDGFRARIESLLADWRHGLAQALERGIGAGTVRAGIDTESTAAFLVAALEGIAGSAKGTGDRQLLLGMARVLESFLDGLRPAPVGVEVGA